MSQTNSKPKPKVVIAGASGFIGQAVAAALSHDFELIGLSRSGVLQSPHFAEVRRADLFSLKDAESGLAGADYGVYLVHSMLPSAALVQGHFADLDLLCADNFARAAAKVGMKQIVYLGGLHPRGDRLSRHLHSRVEVALALANTNVAVTHLRAGLILGANGSSFQILRRLVHRLPMMLCPSWTSTRMQPVALDDVVAAVGTLLGDATAFDRTYDLGAPEVVTYRQLLLRTAAAMGVQRRCLPVPLFSPRLSRLWVSLTTGAPKSLVAPLVESLKHEMIADPDKLWVNPSPTSIDEALRQALTEPVTRQPRAFIGTRKGAPTVRSVQRMTLPKARDAAWALEAYIKWLPRALSGLLTVKLSDDDQVHFRLFGFGPPLLVLQPLRHRSDNSRQVLRVIGGLLAKETCRGRLEFRQVPDENTLIAAIHEYEPTLPWWLYRLTQAQFHRWVMSRFARYLKHVGRHQM
ncbi:MAG TPA: NmrA family protein [Myxococcales bacterium]|nr:NmrA family protein [Myxococcales bacterium]